jgi:hypothetical protein
MRNWRLVWQIEYENFEPIDVLCKQITSFPVIDALTGERKFRLLPRNLLILQIVAEADGDQHRLKVIKKGRGVKFVWQQPDRMEHSTMQIGLGKSGRRCVDSRREIVDTLAPKCRVPGDKAEFGTRADFVEYVNRILGNELGNAVMTLFDQRLRGA